MFVIIGIFPMFSGEVEFKPELYAEIENASKRSFEISLLKIPDGTLTQDLMKSLNLDPPPTLL